MMLTVPKGEAEATGKKVAVADLKKFSDPAIKRIKEQLKEVEKEINSLISANPEYETSMALVRSIPGVGRMTALSLILFTRNFTLFDDPRNWHVIAESHRLNIRQEPV